MAMPPPPSAPMETPLTLREPVGTGTLTSWQTVVDVVVGDASSGGAGDGIREIELPLSVVALSADSTWCSAWPFPSRGCVPGVCDAVGLGVEPPATSATGTATTTSITAATAAIPARRHVRGRSEP